MSARSNRRYLRNRAAILRGNPTCYICGKPIDTSQPLYLPTPDGRRLNPQAPSADHVQALANGGTHDRANLRPAHLGCNMAKSNKPHAKIIRRSGSLD